MRRRARRLHLKCRPKVERTTFRHSLIRCDRRARSSRIGAKNAERDGSATTYESTGIVCSGASNSFGGAMMIFFDGASRCVCCDVSASSQKNEDVFVKDDDFLPLFPLGGTAKKYAFSRRTTKTSLRNRGLVVCQPLFFTFLLSP